MNARSDRKPPTFSGLEVWFVDLQSAASALDDIEAATPRLSPDQISMFKHMRVAQAAAERRAAHIALRVLIERAVGPLARCIPFAISHGGKPRIAPVAGQPGPELDFSLSHASGCALIGLSTVGAIGADIEVKRPVRIPEDRLARMIAAARCLTNADTKTSNSTIRHGRSPDDRTDGACLESDGLRAWVRLEAYAKMDGRGVGRVLTRLGIVGGPTKDASGKPMTAESAAERLIEASPGAQIHDLDVGTDRYAAAATYTDDQRTPLTLDLQYLPNDMNEIARLVAC